MTKLEKIEEIIREYENGCNAEITAEDIIKGIDRVLSDSSGIYESEIEKAKKAITDFCDREYDTQADLDNLYNVNFAYTTITDNEIPLRVSADLINCKINYTLGENILAKSESYSSLALLAEDISNSSFDDWVTVYDLPSDKINEYLTKNNSDFDIIDGELIKYCGSAQIITVPDNVDTIGTDAFLKCEAKEINLPNSVQCIDDWAFTGCTNLEHIDIPDSVSTIGRGAFDGCTNLKSASIGRTTAVFSGDAFPLRCKVTRRNSEPKQSRSIKV